MDPEVARNMPTSPPIGSSGALVFPGSTASTSASSNANANSNDGFAMEFFMHQYVVFYFWQVMGLLYVVSFAIWDSLSTQSPTTTTAIVHNRADWRLFADLLDRLLLFYYVNEVATQLYTVGSFTEYWKNTYNRIDFGVVCANVGLEYWYFVTFDISFNNDESGADSIHAPSHHTSGFLAIIALALRISFRVLRLFLFLSRAKEIVKNPEKAVSFKLGGPIRRTANSGNLVAMRKNSKEEAV
jgi:hypothetical protein